MVAQFDDELARDQAAHVQLCPHTLINEQWQTFFHGDAFAFDNPYFVALGFNDDGHVKVHGFGIGFNINAFHRADFHTADQHRGTHI